MKRKREHKMLCQLSLFLRASAMGCGTFVSLILTLIILTYFWVRKKFAFLGDNGFLYEAPSFPMGSLTGAGTKLHLMEITDRLYKKFKGKAKVFGMYFFTSPVIVVTDLETVKHVLVRDFEVFHNRGGYFNAEDDPLSAHLFAIDDGEWKRMRAKLTPTFTSGKMKMMFNVVRDISEIMIKQLKTEQNLDMIEIKDTVAKFTTDVIGNVVFGLETNSITDPDSKFREMGRKALEFDSLFQAKIAFLAVFRNFGRKLGMRFWRKDVSDFFMTTIRDTVVYRKKNKIERNDVMDLLIKMTETTDGEPLTFDELAAQCFLYFVAGFETSSSTSCFALYALALNQDIQNKTREEIKKVLAKHDGQVTYEAILEMKYLQMVVDETLRIYGPVFTLIRQASKNYKVEGTTLLIRKGTLILIPLYSIHMDPENYPEPEKFDPERFSDENKRDRHPMAHLPFGEGPRNCIGLRFGLMQTKVGLVQLLTNFKFSPNSRTTIPMRFSKKALVMSPEDDMWLKVEKL